MKTKIIFSEKCLEYGQPTHPDNASRVEIAAKILRQKKYAFAEPQPASESDLLLVHMPDYIEAVKESSIEDPDTPMYKNIFKYARLSAGGAILAAKTNGFSLMRPPGHHAGRSGKALGAVTRGFCYFNNLAIAVRYLGKKTVVIDIDGHHGNGTQEIFAGDEKVTYISLHRKNIFPQTGSQSCGNLRNYPLHADCGGQAYLETFDLALKESNRELAEAEVIAVSAGFDTHAGDLVSLGLAEKDFNSLGSLIASLKKPAFFVLEGGYDGNNLGHDIDAFLKGFEA